MSAPARRSTVGDRVAADLRAAVDVLSRDGWIRENLHRAGGHDITGAVYVATGYHQQDESGQWRAHPLERSAGRRASDCIAWLARLVPARFVSDFNDRQCLDADTAMDTLRRAADDAQRLLREPRDVERLLVS